MYGLVRTGYLSQEYLDTFTRLGEVLSDPQTGSCLIKRKIPNTDYFDYISPYPFSFFPHRPKIDDRAISSLIITPPIDPIKTSEYIRYGQPYKDHYIVDLQDSSISKYSEQHKRNVNKAKGEIEINVGPPSNLQWQCYQELMKRHSTPEDYITNYDLETFKKLFSVPGSLCFNNFLLRSYMVGMSRHFLGFGLFYIQNQDVYFHIGASTLEGYENGNSYLIINHAITVFKHLGYRYLILGAEHTSGNNGGLSRFKSGWGSFIKTNKIIKHIHNQEIYDMLSKNVNKESKYFPLYRS